MCVSNYNLTWFWSGLCVCVCVCVCVCSYKRIPLKGHSSNIPYLYQPSFHSNPKPGHTPERDSDLATAKPTAEQQSSLTHTCTHTHRPTHICTHTPVCKTCVHPHTCMQNLRTYTHTHTHTYAHSHTHHCAVSPRRDLTPKSIPRALLNAGP